MKKVLISIILLMFPGLVLAGGGSDDSAKNYVTEIKYLEIGGGYKTVGIINIGTIQQNWESCRNAGCVQVAEYWSGDGTPAFRVMYDIYEKKYSLLQINLQGLVQSEYSLVENYEKNGRKYKIQLNGVNDGKFLKYFCWNSYYELGGDVLELTFQNDECQNKSRNATEYTLKRSYVEQANELAQKIKSEFAVDKYKCDANKYDEYAKEITDKIENMYGINLLNDNKLPSFIHDLNAFKTIIAYPKEFISQLEKKCLAEIENDNSLSDEAKKSKQDEVSNKIENAKQNTDDRLNEILKSIDAKPIETVEIKPQSCESLLGNPKKEGTPAYYLTFAFKVVRFVALIILIVMSVIDFVTAIASHDEDALKKAKDKLIKRFILAILIFLLPTLIEFILTNVSERDASLCLGEK